MKLWQPDDYLGWHLPVAGADWRVGATDDLQYQVLHASRLQQATTATDCDRCRRIAEKKILLYLESVFECGALVQDTAERPQIRLVVVRLGNPSQHRGLVCAVECGTRHRIPR